MVVWHRVPYRPDGGCVYTDRYNPSYCHKYNNIYLLSMIMRKLLPLLLLALFIGVTQLISHFKPVAAIRDTPPTPVITVETAQLMPRDYTVVVNSFGRVQPRTEGELVAQVSGQIIDVSPNFRDGGFFEAGETLITIDPRDYKIQVDIAAAELANAR